MVDTFRLVPPAVQPGWIERPRLVEVLARRYAVEVLAVVAPAGYGKTAALAAAIHANEDGHLGHDLWLQCDPGDDDPDVFAAALLTATGLDPPGSGFVGTADKVADALLRLAPRPVCLVLDDVHVLDPDSGGMALLGELVERLPTHAHLVVSGRTRLPLRLARRRAQGRAEELSVDDLAFDDAELDLAAPGHGDADVARWPAMASLLGGGTPTDTVQFLLEEVATALGEDRLAVLAALARVPTVDDGVALAASKGELDADTLLSALPLVHRTPSGTYQLHDLWKEALAIEGEPKAAAALSRVGELYLEGERHRAAAELFLAAGDHDGVARAAESIATQALMFQNLADLRRLADLTVQVVPDRPITAVLNATVAMTGNERASADLFAEAAMVAREAGDVHVEAIALYNTANMIGVVDPYGFPDWLAERAEVLAGAGDHLAGSLVTLLASHEARAEGDVARAVDLLREPLPMAMALSRVQHAFAMSDLGRPEEVATPSAAEAVSEGGGPYLAQAIWLRGEIAPEPALELGRVLSEPTGDRRVPHVQVSTNAVLTFVALAAGAVGEARLFADRAARWMGETSSEYVQTFISLADTAVLLAEQGEEAARRRLERMLAQVPVEPWPYRSYLYALPMIYALAPSSRATIDRCQFGPSLTAVQQAAQALVRLREHDDPSGAVGLPWNRPWLLRAHVAPPHLAQLAAAAAAAGHAEVGQVLDQLPSLRDHLQAAAELDHGATAAWARIRVESLPARPDHDLRVDVLGSIRAFRGGTEIGDEGWVRRERVRQLLAHLLLHRRMVRYRIAEDLWPDLSGERALDNLRVNLNHLQHVLQPGRATGEPPWFVRTDGDHLVLAPEGIEVDADHFERACDEARRLDERAQGTLAIDAYRAVADAYTGDYLVDWPYSDWAAVERVRLRTLATAGIARLGELLLARGEPEEATSWAAVALRHEPLLERAHRLLARGLAGQGNAAAARATLADLAARLADEGLVTERETEQLAEQLGARSAGG